jgi:hypothetical protein
VGSVASILGLGDPFWKERHAKGVPVKMRWTDLDKFLAKIAGRERYALYGISGNDLNKGGDPYAVVMAEGLRASFCNFRYKQSWLDKKGGERE